MISRFCGSLIRFLRCLVRLKDMRIAFVVVSVRRISELALIFLRCLGYIVNEEITLTDDYSEH